MTIGRRLSQGEVRNKCDDVKRKRVRIRRWSRKRYEISEGSGLSAEKRCVVQWGGVDGMKMGKGDNG